MTCRTCGQIKVKTRNNSYNFIPSLSLGFQKQISNYFSLNISSGFQYLSVPSVTWEASNNVEFPSYVHNKIDSIIQNSTKNLERYGNIIPTINLSIRYIF